MQPLGFTTTRKTTHSKSAKNTLHCKYYMDQRKTFLLKGAFINYMDRWNFREFWKSDQNIIKVQISPKMVETSQKWLKQVKNGQYCTKRGQKWSRNGQFLSSEIMFTWFMNNPLQSSH